MELGRLTFNNLTADGTWGKLTEEKTTEEKKDVSFLALATQMRKEFSGK